VIQRLEVNLDTAKENYDGASEIGWEKSSECHHIPALFEKASVWSGRAIR